MYVWDTMMSTLFRSRVCVCMVGVVLINIFSAGVGLLQACDGLGVPGSERRALTDLLPASAGRLLYKIQDQESFVI